MMRVATSRTAVIGKRKFYEIRMITAYRKKKAVGETLHLA
jgi:hypothetical protein